MLKAFLLTHVMQPVQDPSAKSQYIEDPFRAAVIMIYVCRKYQIKLDQPELLHLCTTLCLPKLDKDPFLQYWAAFSQDVTVLKK